MSDDEPEDPRVRTLVRELGTSFGEALSGLLERDMEIVILARPAGTERTYFVTNTPHAGVMMSGFKKRIAT